MREKSQSLRKEVNDQITKCEQLEGRNEGLNARLSETTRILNTTKDEVKQKDADTKNLETELEGMKVETDELKNIIDETEKAKGVIEREREGLASEIKELKSNLELSQKEQKDLADRTEEQMKAKDTAFHQLGEKAKEYMVSRERELALVKSDLKKMSDKCSGLQSSYNELEEGNRLMVNSIERLMGGGRTLFKDVEDNLFRSGRRHDRHDQYDPAKAQEELTPKSSLKRRRVNDDEALLRTPGESFTE